MLYVYDAVQINNLNGVLSQFGNGFFRIATGSQPAVNSPITGSTVTQVNFQATPFQSASASGGLVIAQVFPSTVDTNAIGGIPGYFVCFDAFGDPLATGTVAPSGADFNFPYTFFPAGSHFQLTNFFIAMPEA